MKRTRRSGRRGIFGVLCVLAGAPLGPDRAGVEYHVAAAHTHLPVVTNLLVVNGRGGIGSTATPAGRLISVENGRVGRTVVRGLLFPYQGGIAPSADGASILFGNETAGLWSVRPNGTQLHRLVATPTSTFRNLVGVEHVVWSAQGRVAFSVNTENDTVVTPNQDRAFGIWVMPVRGNGTILRAPRRVASPAQIGAQVPASNSFLSWSRDGKRLITSPTSSTVISFDVARGTTQIVVRGGEEAAVSPASGDLAYVTGGLHPGAPSSLWVAGAEGRHPRRIVSASSFILHPVWSPDGHQIAYIAATNLHIGAVGGTEIHVVTAATAFDRIVLRADSQNAPLLSHGYFADLAWAGVLKR